MLNSKPVDNWSAQGGLRAHPHDVVNGQLIAEDDFPVLVDVDDRSQPGIGQSEEIEERGVLSVGIGIVLIVHATLVVAQEEVKDLRIFGYFLQKHFGKSMIVFRKK